MSTESELTMSTGTSYGRFTAALFALSLAAAGGCAMDPSMEDLDLDEATMDAEFAVQSAPRNLARDPGTVASAQSTFSGYSASRAIDGSTTTTVGPSYSWANAHTSGPDGRLPQWFQVNLAGQRVIETIRLYTSAGYELKDYDLQAWDGSSWRLLAQKRGNSQTVVTHTLQPITASKVRVISLAGPDAQVVYARINELQIIGHDVGTWTVWLNRDAPSGNGDYETLADFVASGQACASPIGIQCQTLGGVDWTSTGQVYTCSPSVGGVCKNSQQANGQCLDYRIRLLCP